ncbi:MAG: hypothetical protein ACYCXY_07780 [Acidimicrobiales bacterium]
MDPRDGPARAPSGEHRRGLVPILLGLAAAAGTAVGLLATSGGARPATVPARIDLGVAGPTAASTGTPSAVTGSSRPVAGTSSPRRSGAAGVVVVTPRRPVVVEGENEHDAGQDSGGGGGGGDTGS